MRFTIADTIAARCFAQPEAIALEVLDGSSPVTYAEVWRRIVGLADAVKEAPHGRHGPMVGLLLPNGVDAALAYAACQRTGSIALPINARLSDREITDVIADADCQLVISANPMCERAARVCQPLGVDVVDANTIPTPAHADRPVLGENERGDAPCVVAYSSGTTGLPKGAIYSNDYFTMNNYRWGWEFGLCSDHVILITGPMFHLSYAGFTLAGLMIGARIRIMPEFDAATAFEELSNDSSFAFLVPSMLSMLEQYWLTQDQHPIAAARHIISAGAPLPLALAKQAMGMFPNARIAEMYGSTESGFVTYEVKDPKTLLAHCVGWPAVGADVQVFDENGNSCAVGEAGEVGVKSGVPFAGYLGAAANASDVWHQGYLLSGDIGLWQPDGRLCIVDRKKDMIITGGENVFTAEVERVLLEHPNIIEAAVVGVPNDPWGEQVCALLVLEDGPEPSKQHIEDFCRESLAAYKVPRRIEFATAIPRNAMGKVQKFRVVEALVND